MFQEPLSYNSAAVIVVTIQAKDKNYYQTANTTVEEDPSQVATAEVTFYIQAYKADSPQFASPWTPSDPRLEFSVKEQQPVGTVLFRLAAHDPITGLAVTQVRRPLTPFLFTSPWQKNLGLTTLQFVMNTKLSKQRV